MTERRDYEVTWTVREEGDGGDGRTIEGLAVPYGVPTVIGGVYEETIAPGAVDTAGLVGRPLLYRHNEVIGVIRDVDDTKAGPVIRARVSATSVGEDALTLARDGAVTGLSIGFDPVDEEWSADRRAVTRTLIDVREVSLAAFPAHSRARVLAVREDKPVPDTAPVMDEGRVASLIRETAPSIDEVRELRDQVAKVRADLDDDNRHRHQHLPWQNRGEFARDYFDAVRNPEKAPEFNRTVDDVLMSENTGLNPVSWMSNLINDVRVGRPLTEAIGVQALPASGLTVQWPKITTRPTTGDQASEQAEPSSTAMVIEYVSGTVFTEAGINDVSWQSIDRSTPEAVAALLSLFAESYARRWDVRVATQLATTSGAQAFATGAWSLAEIAGDLAAAAATISAAAGAAPDLVVLAPNLFFNVGLITGSGFPIAGGNIGTASLGTLEYTMAGLRVVCCPLLTTNTGYILNRQASVALLESPGAPFTVQADAPATGSRSIAVYGYGAIIEAPAFDTACISLTKTA